MTVRRRGSRTQGAAALLVLGLVASACSGGGSDAADDPFGDPGDCTVIDVAVSSEKIDLMNDLARSFNRSDASELGDGCAFVRPYSKASGGATTALADGWDEAAEGARPVIWSPAASMTRAALRWAPPTCSGTMPSMIFSSSRSWAVIFMPVAASLARVESCHRIEAAPSGEITE